MIWFKKTTSTGNLIFHITGAFAEFERNIIRERVNTGLETARARGRKGGRPTLITSEKIQMAKLLYNDKTLNIQDILKQLNVKKSCYCITAFTLNQHKLNRKRFC